MKKNSNKYIFKYNQEGELYNYIELNKADKVVSYFKIEDNTLIRFDKNNDIKQLIKFKQKVKLKQKFMVGESFITVFDVETDECVQHKMPEKEKQITLVKNNISVSDFGKFVVERWKEINKKDNKNPIEFPIKVKGSLLSNLKSFLENSRGATLGRGGMSTGPR